ncbi:hypothetical protein JCM3766R1_002825 [Sporobolomyces carnicolor]
MSSIDLSKLGYYLYVSQRYMIGYLGVFLWDHLSLLPLEIKYMWKDKRWTVTKIAFLINRYWGLLSVITVFWMVFGNISNSLCGRINWFLSVLVTFSTIVCDVIVGIRVYAIYDCKKYMLAILATFVAAETALMVRTVVRLVRLTNINVYPGAVLKSLMCTRLILGLRQRADPNLASKQPRPQAKKAAPIAMPGSEVLPPWIPPHLVAEEALARANDERRLNLARASTRA